MTSFARELNLLNSSCCFGVVVVAVARKLIGVVRTRVVRVLFCGRFYTPHHHKHYRSQDKSNNNVVVQLFAATLLRNGTKFSASTIYRGTRVIRFEKIVVHTGEVVCAALPWICQDKPNGSPSETGVARGSTP